MANSCHIVPECIGGQIIHVDLAVEKMSISSLRVAECCTTPPSGSQQQTVAQSTCAICRQLLQFQMPPDAHACICLVNCVVVVARGLLHSRMHQNSQGGIQSRGVVTSCWVDVLDK